MTPYQYILVACKMCEKRRSRRRRRRRRRRWRQVLVLYALKRHSWCVDFSGSCIWLLLWSLLVWCSVVLANTVVIIVIFFTVVIFRPHLLLLFSFVVVILPFHSLAISLLLLSLSLLFSTFTSWFDAWTCRESRQGRTWSWCGGLETECLGKKTWLKWRSNRIILLKMLSGSADLEANKDRGWRLSKK